MNELQRDLGQIKTDIALIKNDLSYHIKRTDIAEANLKLLHDELKPVKKHVAMAEGALKLVGILALVVTLIGGVLKLTGGMQ